MKYAAERQGVPAQAWFEVGTPQAALNVAAKWLGWDNVFTFANPTFRHEPRIRSSARAAVGPGSLSHSQADDWLEAFESGWPPVMPMPCVLMLGEADVEGAGRRLRPAPDRRELDDVALLGRPGDHAWSSLQLLLFP